MRLGIFGGTFNPPHVAHRILAAEAHHQLHLDRVLWVLTANPPHKQGQPILPLETRLEMLQAALEADPCFVISRVDIDRPAPHYALDTVRLLQVEHPQAELIYLMGGDSLSDLPTWHRPLDFISACSRIGVMRRPGDSIDLAELENQLPGLFSKTVFLKEPLLDISASDLRQRVAEGRPYRYFLPNKVYHIIKDRSLYK
jgi:nicotinate-nucleotide adenylyltransferase